MLIILKYFALLYMVERYYLHESTLMSSVDYW